MPANDLTERQRTASAIERDKHDIAFGAELLAAIHEGNALAVGQTLRSFVDARTR